MNEKLDATGRFFSTFLVSFLLDLSELVQKKNDLGNVYFWRLDVHVYTRHSTCTYARNNATNYAPILLDRYMCVCTYLYKHTNNVYIPRQI
jgi:hypothetical protein